jgi:hypothetical protein
MSNKPRENRTLSKDKQFVLDDKGNKILQYSEVAKGFIPLRIKDKSGKVVDITGNIHVKMDVHWVCHDECIRWDENGKCLQTIRECVPDWAS